MGVQASQESSRACGPRLRRSCFTVRLEGEEEDVALPTYIEGWLLKKSHHLGIWRQRFFRFNGKSLKYWRTLGHAQANSPPRGELRLEGCFVHAGRDGKLVIRMSPKSSFYDEELIAKSAEDRNAWIRCLNKAAVHRRRGHGRRTDVAAFLNAKGLWGSVEEALRVAASWSTPCTAVTGGSSANTGSWVSCCSTAAPAPEPAAPAPELGGSWWSAQPAPQSFVEASSSTSFGLGAALAHAHAGGALLQMTVESWVPRQGAFVQGARRLLQTRARREVPGGPCNTKAWLLLLSARDLARAAEDESVPPLLCGRAPAVAAGSGGGDGSGVESLQAFASATDDAAAFARMSLLRCEVGRVRRCPDGGGWFLRVQEISDEDTEELEDADAQPSTAECSATGSSVAEERAGRRRNVWVITVGRREECESWRRTILTACWSARSRAAGVPRTREEALAAFVEDPAAWRRRLTTRLVQAKASFWAVADASGVPSAAAPASSSTAPVASSAAATAFGPLIAALEAVCADAEELLETARDRPRLRREVCQASWEAAFHPALECAASCWARCGGSVPPAQGSAMLVWLERHRHTLHRLGVVCSPFSVAIERLAADLALRRAEQSRQIVSNTLFRHLSEAVGSPGSRAPLSTDLFSMLDACLPLDDCQGSAALRSSFQRALKFLLYEVQDALWGWLLETHSEVVAAPSSEEPLGRKPQRWLSFVASLANSIPTFVEKCRGLGLLPLPCGEVDEGYGFDSDGERCSRFGAEALPSGWSLATEAARFEHLGEALLWAISDLLVGRLRTALVAAPDTAFVGGVPALLKEHLEPPLESARRGLSPRAFERLLPKLFHVALSLYLLRAIRGAWFQEPPSAGHRSSPWSVGTVSLCDFFADRSAEGRAPVTPVELGRVQRLLNCARGARADASRLATALAQEPETAALAKLVGMAAVGPQHALPVWEVAYWFAGGPDGGVAASPFDEMPLFEARLDYAVQRGGQQPSVPAAPAVCERPEAEPTSVAAPSADGCADAGGRWWKFSLFGHAAVGDSRGARPPPAPPPMMLGAGAPAPAPAAEPPVRTSAPHRKGGGEAGRRRLQDIDAFGFFCLADMAATEAERRRPWPRRRWVRLAAHAGGVFEVYGERPGCTAHALSSLQEAALHGNTELELVFTEQQQEQPMQPAQLSRHGCARQEQPTQPTQLSRRGRVASAPAMHEGRPVVRYLLRLECPSHLQLCRELLRLWSPGGAQIPESPLPLIAGKEAGAIANFGGVPPWRSGDDDAQEEEAAGWGALPALTTEVLRRRLGGVWRDLRPRLAAASAALPPAPREADDCAGEGEDSDGGCSAFPGSGLQRPGAF